MGLAFSQGIDTLLCMERSKAPWYVQQPYVWLWAAMMHLTLNLVAWLVMDKAAAEFFSNKWYGTWFPGYAVWLTLYLTTRSR